MKFPNVALIGGMGSGKSTILGELCRRYGYTQMSWATPVKELAALAYGQVEKNREYEIALPSGIIIHRTGREILQRIGTDALRDQVDNDFWIKAGINRMDENPNQVQRWANDDSRFPNEIAALRTREFAVVRLVVPDHVRAERLGLTSTQLDELSRHPSETQISELDADIDIQNVDTPGVVTERIILHLADLMAA